jgi:hypothetical protein
MKILIYDLETFPNIGYTWGKWEQNVIKFTKEWEIASFAYKWLDSPQVRFFSQRDYNEKEVVRELHRLFSEADVTIAHNGDQFDLKKAKTKFLQYGLKPPTMSKSIDTKKIAKSQFAFNSNSLNDLGESLGLGKKINTGGFDLWLDCMSGKRAAWDKMIAYNKQDVLLLEKVYLKLRSWNPHHPNVSLLSNKPGCPTCGSSDVQSRGFTVTTKTKQQRYQCKSCGRWYTGKLAKDV